MTTTEQPYEALFIGHNGMGDNLNMIGAVRFLLPFYQKVYFVVKIQYVDRVSPFLKDSNVNFLKMVIDAPAKESELINGIVRTFKEKPNTDLFITGCWRNVSKEIIRNKAFIEARDKFKKSMENKNVLTFDHDMLTQKDYYFLPQFYENLGLHFNIYFEYFDFPAGVNSEKLYDSVKHYKNIIFMQNKSSCGRMLSINNLLQKYLNDPDAILISNDENIYEKYDSISSNKDENDKKKQLVQPFVLGNIVDYKDVIMNSTEIYIIDSCLVSVIIPLFKANKLKAHTLRIINRNRLHEPGAQL